MKTCPRCAKQVAGIHTCAATPLVGKLEREVARLTAERDALKQDAERYRWLRDTADGSVFAILLCDEPSAWDGIVDSAIAAKGE